MIPKFVPFTWKITTVDYQQARFTITYTPDDDSLIPMLINVRFQLHDYKIFRDDNGNLLYPNQDSVPFSAHLEECVKSNAPHYLWGATEMMLANEDHINSKM